MALITGFAIDEAKEMELADGGAFGNSLFGSQVIEAARELLLQQTEQPDDPVPQWEFFERQGDMGQARLRLILDGDSDVTIAVIGAEGDMADVEFCTSFSGGGRSPAVREALLDLCRAIRSENVSHPLVVEKSGCKPIGCFQAAFAVAYKSSEYGDWSLLQNSLMFDQDAACSHAGVLAQAGDTETQYSAVKIDREGVKPVGDIYNGVLEI